MQALIPEHHRIARQKGKDRACDAQNRCQVCRRVRVLDRLPQRDIAQIEQPEDQERGQPGVPGPPRPPHRLAPDRPGHEADQREGQADRRRRPGRQCADMVPPDQPDQRPRQHHEPRRHRHHGAGHMQIDDLDGRALLEIIRGKEKAPDQPADQHHDCQSRNPRQCPGRGLHELFRIGVVPDRHGAWLPFHQPEFKSL